MDYLFFTLPVILLIISGYMGFRFPRASFLLVVPFMALVLILYEISGADYEPVPYVFMPIAAMLGIMFSRRINDEENWAQFLVKWILIIVLSLIALFLLFIVSGWLFVIGGLGICLIIRHQFQIKRDCVTNILLVVAAALRQNLPLTTCLNMAAEKRRGKYPRALRRISAFLTKGLPLSTSMELGCVSIPADIIAKVKIGEKTNQLNYVFDQIESRLISKVEENKKLKPVQPEYYLLLLIALMTIGWALTTFIVPKHIEVISEMSDGMMQLPWQTQFLVELVEPISPDFRISRIGVAAIVLPVVFLLWMHSKIRRRKLPKPYLTTRISDIFKWYMPCLGWYEKNYSMLNVIEALGSCFRMGATVDDGIETAAILDMNWVYKKRVLCWLEKIRCGQDVVASAKVCRVGHPMVMIFDPEINGNDAGQMIELMQKILISNYSYRVNLARFIFWPVMTVCYGLIFGFFVYAMYIPAVAIIECVMNWMP